MKKGILLVAFGSTRQEAHLPLKHFDARVRDRFPGIPSRWAFTSGIVRHRLADTGKKTDSVRKALEKMWFEKYTQVAVQSLHVIAGSEYHNLEHTVHTIAQKAPADGGFEHISLGRPLITTPADVMRVVEAVFSCLPQERGPQDAVVLMGHGTWHAGDTLYESLHTGLQKQDSNVHLATMEGQRTIDTVCSQLLCAGVREAFLIPLLAIAGQHVHKDMNGPQKTSWRSLLNSAGIACRSRLQGAAEYDAFTTIWLDHLQKALNRLER